CNLFSQAALASQFVNVSRDHNVLNRDSVRTEQSNLLGTRPPGSFSSNNLSEFQHGRPPAIVLAKKSHQIARFHFRLSPRVGGDHMRSPHCLIIKLSLVWKI